MKAGPHTNPAAPARHRPPSPPRGNDRKALQLSATSPLREEVIAGRRIWMPRSRAPERATTACSPGPGWSRPWSCPSSCSPSPCCIA